MQRRHLRFRHQRRRSAESASSFIDCQLTRAPLCVVACSCRHVFVPSWLCGPCLPVQQRRHLLEPRVRLAFVSRSPSQVCAAWPLRSVRARSCSCWCAALRSPTARAFAPRVSQMPIAPDGTITSFSNPALSLSCDLSQRGSLVIRFSATNYYNYPSCVRYASKQISSVRVSI